MSTFDVTSLLRATCGPACGLQLGAELPDASATSSSASSSSVARRPQLRAPRGSPTSSTATSARHPDPPSSRSQRALLLQLVCPYLSPLDRSHLRLTCSDGRLAANAAVTNATFLPEDGPEPARIAFLAACPNIRALRIHALRADETLGALLPLSSLHAVHAVHLDTPLYVPNFSLCLMAVLWTNLQTVHVHAGAGGISADLLSGLATQPHLHTLTLLGCQAVSSAEWGPLAALHGLTSLHLGHVRHLPFLTLAALLAPLPYLASFTLTDSALYSEPADPRNASALAPLRALTALRVKHTTGFPAAAALSPAGPPALRHVCLSASIAPDTPTPLADALPPGLTHLDLSRNPLAPDVLPAPLCLPRLRHLDLSNTHLSPEPCDLLASAGTLVHLDLTHCALSPATFHSALPHLTRLTHLAFSSAPRSLEPLAHLTRLRVLHAPALPLDRVSVPPLAQLPLLHTLTVRTVALWPAMPPLAALTSLTATAARKFGDYDFADIAAVTTPALASLALRNAHSLTPDAIPSLIKHLPCLSALSLTGLFALPPAAAALIGAHPSLHTVALGFVAADPEELQVLQDHLQACHLAASCSNEAPAALPPPAPLLRPLQYPLGIL